MTIKTSRNSGFTLVEIILVASIIGMLAVICIPNIVKARGSAQQTVCINNLRQIDAAKQEWALEMNKPNSATPKQSDLDAYLSRSGHADKIACPAGGSTATFASTYTINSLTNPPTCNVVPALHSFN